MRIALQVLSRQAVWRLYSQFNPIALDYDSSELSTLQALFQSKLRATKANPYTKQEYQTWLQQNIGTLSSADLTCLLRAYIEVQPRGQMLTANEARTLLEAIRMRQKAPSPHSALALSYCYQMAAGLKRVGVDVVSVMREVAQKDIDSAYIRAQTIESLRHLLAAYVKAQILKKNSVLPTKAGLDFFRLVESHLQRELFTADVQEVNEWAYVLIWLIKLDNSSEDFLRAVEFFVISNVGKLTTSCYLDLVQSYSGRKTFDYFYVSMNVLQPVCANLIVRCEYIRASDLKYATRLLWTNANAFGTYCDSALTGALTRILHNNFWLHINPRRQVLKCAENIVALITRAGNFQAFGLFERVVQIVLEDTATVGDDIVCRLSGSFALAHYNNEQLWELLRTRFARIASSEQMYLEVYSLLLNLSVYNPALRSELIAKAEKQCSVIAQRWREAMHKDAKLHVRSWLHGRTVEYLKQKGYEVEEEYYDEYFIDIAMVKKKIALEICGPYHFVMPNLTLNGKTQARKAVLESRGWTVVILPFMKQHQQQFDEEMTNHLRWHITLKDS